MSEQNWGRRVVDSRGGHFRIETGSPRQGRDGPEPTKIYSSNDNGEVFLIAHGHGTGLGRISSDKSIEINAGDKNDPNSIDIRVSAATGDITITASRGRIRLHGKDIMLTADRDVDINAGRNINLHSSCGRILLDANTAQVKALRGNLVPETWGARITKNSFIPDSVLAKIFAPMAQSVISGAAAGSFNGVIGGALKGFGFSLKDLGVTSQTGGIEAVENTNKATEQRTPDPLQNPNNLVEPPTPIPATENQVLTGNIDSLNASASKELGVTEGGNSLTGRKEKFGTGSVGKGAAATVSNQSSDSLATLEGGVNPTHPDIPAEQKLDSVNNATALRMEALKQDLLSAKNTPNALNKSVQTSEDVEQKLLQGEEVIAVDTVSEDYTLE
tara:strand:- start:5127 stop:6287 length:1161 start_codon:yes stop_codon:yes gene_type:complete